MDIRQAGLDGLRRAEASLEKTAARVAQISTALTGEPHDYVDLSTEAVALIKPATPFKPTSSPSKPPTSSLSPLSISSADLAALSNRFAPLAGHRKLDRSHRFSKYYPPLNPALSSLIQ